MKWLLLLFIVIVLLLVFALVRRIQSGSNTYQRKHPVSDGPAASESAHITDPVRPAPSPSPGPAPTPPTPPTEAAPAAEEGWDEAAAPPEVPVEAPRPDAGTQQAAERGDTPGPAGSSGGEPWSETPPTDERAAEVPDPASLASSGTLDSEIAELEGERPDPDQRT